MPNLWHTVEFFFCAGSSFSKRSLLCLLLHELLPLCEIDAKLPQIPYFEYARERFSFPRQAGVMHAISINDRDACIVVHG
jgi:hypothetical protein